MENTGKNSLEFLEDCFSNFKGVDKNTMCGGESYFLGRGLGLPYDFLHLTNISNLGYTRQISKVASHKKFFSTLQTCSKLTNWRIFGQNWRFSDFWQDLSPLDANEGSIMLNSITPYGYLVIPVNHTKNQTFKSAKISDFRPKWHFFVYNLILWWENGAIVGRSDRSKGSECDITMNSMNGKKNRPLRPSISPSKSSKWTI